MKKNSFFYLILHSIALLTSITSCLSSKIIVPSTATATFISTNYLSSTSTIAVPPTGLGSYDDEIATVSAIQTHAANFPRICKDNYYPNVYSPDGLWLVELCYSQDDRDLIMTVSNSETQVLWKLLFQDYIPQMDFVPDGGMLVVHWSNDGRYAYFASHLGGDGGECFVRGWDSGAGLFRLDLETGSVKTILPPNNNFWWYGFSFSPTDRRLVYAARGRNLKILDLNTGQLLNILPKTEFSEGGGYLWSPDGLKFVYSTVTYRPNHVGREGYSLHLVDAQSGGERILLESTKDCFEAKSWTEDNILVVEKNYSEALVEFDLTLNRIIGETPTKP